MFDLNSKWWKFRPYLSIDRRALSLFRIGLCLSQFYDMIFISLPEFDAFHSGFNGMWDESVLNEHNFILHRWWFYRGGFFYNICSFLLLFIICVSYLIGFQTYLCSLLFYLLTVSIQFRNRWPLSGAESMIIHMSFWAMLLPMDMFSVDECLRRRRMKREDNYSIDPSDESNSMTKKQKNTNHTNHKSASILTCESWSVKALYFQMWIIYPCVLLNRWKCAKWDWQQCSAVYYIFASYGFSRNLGQWLALKMPFICYLMCKITIILEWIIPFLIWMIPVDSVRLFTLIIALLMQIGFNLHIRLATFLIVMTVSMIPFLPSSFLDQISEFQWCKSMIRFYQHSLIQSISSMNIIRQINDSNLIRRLNRIFNSFWEISDPYSNRHFIQPTLLNNRISLIILIYTIYNTFGGRPFHLWNRVDDGNIGELFRLTQTWIMFGNVKQWDEYYFVITDVNIMINNDDNNQNTNVSILWNDLHNSGYSQASFFDIHTFIKHENPTYVWKSTRWEKAGTAGMERTEEHTQSILRYFCEETKRKLENRYFQLTNEHQNMYHYYYYYHHSTDHQSEGNMTVDPDTRDNIRNIFNITDKYYYHSSDNNNNQKQSKQMDDEKYSKLLQSVKVRMNQVYRTKYCQFEGMITGYEEYVSSKPSERQQYQYESIQCHYQLDCQSRHLEYLSQIPVDYKGGL